MRSKMQRARDSELIERDSLIDEVLGACAPGRLLALTGPRGIGKTYFLGQLARRLARLGKAATRVEADHPNAVDEISAIPSGHIILCDDLHRASVEFIGEVRGRVAAGATIIAALAENHDSVEQAMASDDLLSLFAADTSEAASTIRYFRVPPLPDAEVLAMVWKISPRTLDSVTVEAIRCLAWGRPAWVHELVQLALNGGLHTVPLTRISGTHADQQYLPSMAWARAVVRDGLDQRAICGAVVLAELTPRTLSGVADLIGSDIADTLLRKGVLLAAPSGGDEFAVPQILAAALQPFTDHAELRQLRVQTAERLFLQEMLGVPLPDSEATFCAHVYGADADAAVAGPELRGLLRRVAGCYIDFGDCKRARELLLRRAADNDQLESIERVRLATVIQGSVSGLRLLQTQQPDPFHGSSVTEDFEALFPWAWLTALLESESRVEGSRRRADVIDEPGFDVAMLPALRWNDEDPLGEDFAMLFELSQHHPRQEIALAAEVLINIELTRHGLVYEASRDLTSRQRLSELVLFYKPEFHDLIVTLLLAKGVLVMTRGEHASGGRELYDIAARLPSSSRHHVWIKHLLETTAAASGGRLDVARLEWSLLHQRLPRFIPRRLRMIVTAIGNELNGTTPADGRLDFAPYQLMRYTSGRFDDIDLSRIPPHPSSQVQAAAPEMPLLRVARAHLAASEAHNPAALMRVSAELRELELWAPATYALQEARAIFLRRRATRNVMRCDEGLRHLVQAAQHGHAWFDVASLPTTSEGRLTPREIEVAKLVSRQLSNREIADQLNCSVRTVETHVAQVRAKLGRVC